MKVLVKEVNTGYWVETLILPAVRSDMPLKKYGWKFNWRTLFSTPGAQFYKLVRQGAPDVLEGMVMISLFNGEMVYMNNIEVAPHNYGRHGKYEGVAGCLIAYSCKKSFEIGGGPYLGFLAFDSKTELISLYEEKYGATWATGQKMFISPENGKKLMHEYLRINLTL